MRLEKRINLQYRTLAQDNAGQPIETWATYRRCWAHVEDVAANERASDGEPVEAVVKTTFQIRYPHGGPQSGRFPEPTHRVLWNEGEITRTSNLETIRRLDSGRRDLLLTGTEVQAD